MPPGPRRKARAAAASRASKRASERTAYEVDELKKVWKDSGLTLQELATLAGLRCSSSSLGRKLGRLQKFELGEFHAVEEALGLKEGWLTKPQ